jgi:hypothetical protein
LPSSSSSSSFHKPLTIPLANAVSGIGAGVDGAGMLGGEGAAGNILRGRIGKANDFDDQTLQSLAPTPSLSSTADASKAARQSSSMGSGQGQDSEGADGVMWMLVGYIKRQATLLLFLLVHAS